MHNTFIKAKVDDLVKWQNLMEQCKKEIDRLKSDFNKLGESEFKNKKIKQIEFLGSNNSKVIITNSEKVTISSYTILEQIFGDMIKDFAKPDFDYKYTEPFKAVLKAIVNGTYDNQKVDDVIGELTEDAATKTVLKKKLKGNWKKDVEILKTVAGLTQKDAEEYAFFISEAFNYERIVSFLKAAGHEEGSESFRQSLETIKLVVKVDEIPKVEIDSEAS